MLTRTKLRNLRLDVEGAFGFNTKDNSSKSTDEPSDGVNTKEKSSVYDTHSNMQMAALTRNDMEDLLKTWIVRRCHLFNRQCFRGSLMNRPRTF